MRGPREVRFGANYVPSHGWFYSWLDFRPDDVRRDFADLAGLGLDHVRIFPIWPWIQPNRGLIRQQGVDDVLTTVDIAGELGLTVAVDLLQGHLSSFDFLPSWALTWHRGSLFEDPRIREGIAGYVATMASALASRDNVFAITIGNEVNNLWPASSTSFEASRSFAEEMLAAIRSAAPGVLALLSLYDDALYAAGHPFSARDQVELGDLTTVHSWIFNGAARVDGTLAAPSVTHADYLVELAAAYAAEPDRPVWLQEVGAPRPEVDDLSMAAFVSQTVEYVLENPALWAITWWCSHDIDRRLADFPEREYDLGLFTTDHRPKPAADALAKAIHGAVRPPRHRRGLVCPVDLVEQPGRRAEVAPGSAFHREWAAARSSGPVAIVAPGRRDDPGHLAARGVTLR